MNESNPYPILEQLWLLAEIEARRTDTDFSMVFEPIGLILLRPISNLGYESTPENALTFATTGGDGVHYSLVQLEGSSLDDSPVVMTVPMNFGEENYIVGGDMQEFLGLGCQVGYTFLEQFTYSKDKSKEIEYFTHPDKWFAELQEDVSAEKVWKVKNLLAVLRKELGLQPWDEVSQRLGHLQKQYMPLLNISTD